MLIGEVETQKCGECPLIDWCGDAFDDLCLCIDNRLSEIEIDKYIELAESSQAGADIEYDKTEDEDYHSCRVKEAICEDVILRLSK